MKTSWLTIVLLLVFTVVRVQGQGSQSGTPAIAGQGTVPAQDMPYAVVSKGANQQVWQKTTYETLPSGQMIPHVHQYTELATGLHYLKNGQWLDSKEEIDILPNGTAAATYGQHQAFFPGNIAQGVIELVTPDGKHLKSRPLGLSYDDGSNTVLIAELKDSVGQLTGSNQVIYPDAFTDFKADLRYTYTKAGFEQDIVLREQPPAPEAYGLNPATARLQVLTEFFDAPEPVITRQTANRQNSLDDMMLDFGTMRMMRGKAFSVGDPAQTSARSRGISVAKSWQHLSGRTFLVEELPVQEIGPQLERLPVPAHAGAAMNPPNAAPHKASATRRLPPARLVQVDTNAVQLAKADLQNMPGLVLDYQEIDFDQPDFTFQSGVTYYVPSQINLFGTTTFEGGSVIKFDEQNGGFQVFSSINNQSDPAHPTVLTSMNDDSVGDIIAPHSNGQPGQCMTDPMDVYTNYIELKNFRFNRAEVAFFNYMDASTNIFWNCEFSNCGEIIDLTYGKVVLRNVLNFGVNFYGHEINREAGLGEWYWLDAQNVTSGGDFVFYPDAAQHITLVLTNCILVGSGDELASIARMVNIPDAYATYGAAAVATNAVFESAGNDNYYLATDSSLRNVGTTTIDPDLLAELPQMTTYAPQDGGYPDNDQPDLGYHYPVNEDSDYDGLPDWWEWKYFGNYSHTGSELDAHGHTLLFDYQNSFDPIAGFGLIQQPLDQEVGYWDTVTFSVIATNASGPLTYQWTHNGQEINGATSRSLTLNEVGLNEDDEGTYQVTVSDGTHSVNSHAAELTVSPGSAYPAFMYLWGPRQDYEFKEGVTYFFFKPIELYGNTVIHGGSVMRMAWQQQLGGASLIIKGSLTCDTEPYYPATFTSVEDHSFGLFPWDFWDMFGMDHDLPPQTFAADTLPWLDLTASTCCHVSNLRFCFANQAIVTSALARQLDAWDCQFVNCNCGIVNPAANSTNHLHNVLFANCGAAIGGAGSIDGEQVTADVTHFCLPGSTPNRIALTNSIVWGNALAASSLSTINTAFNPDRTNFRVSAQGNYYLAADSPLRHAGTASISQELQNLLRQKTTAAPINLPALMEISGTMTFGPQAARYTGGAPDLGYYYDALDYSIGDVSLLPGAQVTLLPGTVLAVRNEYVPQRYDQWTLWGFLLEEASSLVSHGTPQQPNVFTTTKLVQEEPNPDFGQALWDEGLGFHCITFIPDCEPASDGTPNPAPALDLRFCKLYLPLNAYHLWGGLNEFPWYDYTDSEASPDSCINWTLRDCALRGGRINLGEPDYFYYSLDAFYGTGAVEWFNNSFDNVTINLDPTFYSLAGTMNCDLRVEADNNLFRGGSDFVIQSIPASAGNWTFKDNLFDKVDFFQDHEGVGLPLDFDHNGYWPKLSRELLWYGDATRLQPTPTSDGSSEVVLTIAPPYQAGPFGNFYLSTLTPLFQAGSRTAAAAGLTNYTTFVNQTKDAAGQPVNIGLHYVAAQSPALNAQPLDSDGDGIPDYVEGEHGTDPNNPMTDGVTNDIYNAIYDDIDLSGDGLTGRAKRILGINPLSQDNPLKLTPVITGQEPCILTYSMPLSIDVDSNQCVLTLIDNGYPAGGYDFVQQTNGTNLVEWNTTFANNGSHILQVELSMPGANVAPEDEYNGIPAVNTVFGPMRSEINNNLVQFDRASTSFGGQAWIYGTLTVQSADYKIDIYDTNSILLKTITNHTDSGVLDEVWDLTTDGGEPRSDQEFNAKVYITPTGVNEYAMSSKIGGSAVSAKDMNNEYTGFPGYPLYLFHMGAWGDTFTMAFGWNDTIMASQRYEMIQENVVDVLFNPGADPYTYNNTFLNSFNGTCFAMWNQVPDATTLTNDLARGDVGNFFWCGHGDPTGFGSAENDADVKRGLSAITQSDLNAALGTHMDGRGWSNRQHPYRLVILNCCDSADDDRLANAFGIEGGTHDHQWFEKRDELPQAFVGWNAIIRVPGCWWWNRYIPIQTSFFGYGVHLNILFTLWMSGYIPIAQCVDAATEPIDALWPFDCPLDKHWVIFGDPNLTRDPDLEP